MDVIDAYKKLVQEHADRREDTIQEPLPTALHTAIVEELNRVQHPRGRPPKSSDVRVSEYLAVRAAQREFRRVEKECDSRDKALERVARQLKRDSRLLAKLDREIKSTGGSLDEVAHRLGPALGGALRNWRADAAWVENLQVSTIKDRLQRHYR
jgi:hypothetical protein